MTISSDVFMQGEKTEAPILVKRENYVPPEVHWSRHKKKLEEVLLTPEDLEIARTYGFDEITMKGFKLEYEQYSILVCSYKIFKKNEVKINGKENTREDTQEHVQTDLAGAL
jgi:hypothetical protein